MKNTNFRAVRAILGVSLICAMFSPILSQGGGDNQQELQAYNPGTAPPPPQCDGTTKPQPAQNLLIEIFFDAPTGLVISQMCTNLEDFGNQVQVKLFPGAGSDVTADNTIDCVNGDCKDDLEFACASQYCSNVFVQYTCCKSAGRSGPQCCNKVGCDWTAIQNCMTTEEPINIINQNRQYRMQYRIKQSELTSVVYNQFHDPCTDLATLYAFFDTTCSLLNPQPPLCSLAPPQEQPTN